MVAGSSITACIKIDYITDLVTLCNGSYNHVVYI